jgi:prepilin-type processing-associated H-X9-DG protein
MKDADNLFADRTPVFAESTWVDGWPDAGNAGISDNPMMAGNDDSGISRFDIPRHGRSINISFLDGHAEQTPLEHLRDFRWSGPAVWDSADVSPR